MRRLAIMMCCLTLVTAAAYIASPLASAWMIREAIRTGDSRYLDTRIEWESVRATLKHSLARHALKLPEDGTTTAPAKPSLWQRLKTHLGRRMVDSVVESYATPTGLPQLFSYGQTYRSVVKGEEDETRSLPVVERMRRFWSRVKRAEFRTPTEFEIELADKHDPGRHYVGLLRLTGFTWKLVELHVRAPAAVGSLAQAWSGLKSAAAPR